MKIKKLEIYLEDFTPKIQQVIREFYDNEVNIEDMPIFILEDYDNV